jgi:oxepin-CoA hydrolase/3-oxo-5,6-dehydrosuberyl-CoA semialdehyde dehydrogenase
MKIAFDVNDTELREAFLSRLLNDALAPLREDSRPKWGAMTAQQMVEHLTWAFESSTGVSSVACEVPEARRQRMKAFLYDNTAMMRDFRNPALIAGLPPVRHPGLAEAKSALAAEVSRFLEQRRTMSAATYTHPVFGPLAAEEWARSHFKHAYHHLLQFELIEDVAAVTSPAPRP